MASALQYANKSILTLGIEAIMLGCDIIMGKCLISMEAYMVIPRILIPDTIYFIRYLQTNYMHLNVRWYDLKKLQTKTYLCNRCMQML